MNIMSNKLKHIQEFKKVLSDYQVSKAAQKDLERTQLVLFVGPSSSGRNTIINELLKSGKYHYIISDTTRKPRKNNSVLEKNGREYWFRNEEEILADLRSGLFLEAAVIHNQQVSGISIRELNQAADERKIAINEVEVVGADNIYNVKKDSMFFFIVPPSVDEWLMRMRMRGALPDDEIRRRLESAVAEISMALEHSYYWFVVNDTFMQTAKKIDTIISDRSNDTKSQKHAKLVATQILRDIKQHLVDTV